MFDKSSSRACPNMLYGISVTHIRKANYYVHVSCHNGCPICTSIYIYYLTTNNTTIESKIAFWRIGENWSRIVPPPWDTDLTWYDKKLGKTVFLICQFLVRLCQVCIPWRGGGVDFCLNLAKFGRRFFCSIDVKFVVLVCKYCIY